ncbi:succinyl-diaminopimelate desuccinylase [Phreatobacter oligotrophus]|uniref:succinyl-diaminopimelate desuccinylase n=1 Tax=Phreatobacter oligotrophus TaxID=1122261 RepID=UPI0023556026|nr:succinyl-diaminopimelate desuccinylase [Phreatobacter oligotrophus]MBX9993099.1 succinyl-diaminopimelate desuccinylase [Phreatobacter oligotrophus]
MTSDPVALARALIQCPSVTPAEGGALAFLESVLKPAGFTVERVTFSEPGTPDVDNLYARIGTEGPHLTFAGHTDVVPPGDAGQWRHGPFAGEIVDGQLYGRGAVDMKGGIACFLAAALDHVAAEGGKPKGSISFLITGDEEGPSVNGTEKLIAWAHQRGERFDHCIVGEPSNPEALGDMIKIGRRGSLSAIVTVEGRQGHVAYPQRAANPIPVLLAILNRLTAEPLDAGNAHFQPSNLEITSIDVGNGATNVIPQAATARFNIRFNDEHTLDSLKARIEAAVAEAARPGITPSVSYARGNSQSFITKPGPFVAMVAETIAEVTGRKPELSTTGGTSDARFIKDYCPVIEFGLVGQTMHAVDERVGVADLVALTAIYRRIIDRYFEG